MKDPDSKRDGLGRARGRDLFIVYGMPRTGTTYLYHALARHPSIFVPYRKESMFFSVNFDKGFDWYDSLFEGQREGEIAADVNPMYFMDDDSLQRVVEYDPAVRVVLGVREPVDFAASLYGNILAHGHKAPDPVETMRHYEWRLTPRRSLRVCLDDHFIQRRIIELCQAFGDSLLIYDFDFFRRSPLPVLTAVESFLGLPSYFSEGNYETAKINASGRKNIMGVNRLLADQRILEAAYTILPKFAIRRIRSALERLSAAGVEKSPAVAPRSPVSNVHRDALGQYLREDRRFYENLFSSKPIVFGSEVESIRDGTGVTVA